MRESGDKQIYQVFVNRSVKWLYLGNKLIFDNQNEIFKLFLFPCENNFGHTLYYVALTTMYLSQKISTVLNMHVHNKCIVVKDT